MISDSEKIFIDGSFNGHYLTQSNPNGSKNKRVTCESHKRENIGYREWHAKAESNEAKGIHQKQCNKCLRWFYPDEF